MVLVVLCRTGPVFQGHRRRRKGKDALNNEKKDDSTDPPLANTVMRWVELED
jgi:hypothetical protein